MDYGVFKDSFSLLKTYHGRDHDQQGVCERMYRCFSVKLM